METLSNSNWKSAKTDKHVFNLEQKMSNKYWILSLQSKILQDTTWTDDHEKKSTMEIIN